jgi:hypothetical protein
VLFAFGRSSPRHDRRHRTLIVIFGVLGALMFSALPASANYREYTFDQAGCPSGISHADGRIWSARNVWSVPSGPGWLQLETETDSCQWKAYGNIRVREDLLKWTGSQWVFCNTGPVVSNNTNNYIVITGWTTFRPCGSGTYYVQGYHWVWAGSNWDFRLFQTPSVSSES